MSLLHEAMRIVLLERASYPATTGEIGAEIKRRGLFSRRDGDSAKAQQINARARQYVAWFDFAEPKTIRLQMVLWPILSRITPLSL
jgi:hypothetical protein